MADEQKQSIEGQKFDQSYEMAKGYEKYYPHWTSEYMKKGMTVFSPYEISGFKTTARRYEGYYIPTVELMSDEIIKTNNPEAKSISVGMMNTVKLMKDIIGYIRVIVGENTSNVVSREDVGKLFHSMSIVEKRMAHYKQLTERNKQFKQVADEIREVTGVGLEDVEKTSKLARREFGKFAPRKGLMETVKQISPGGYELGSSLLSGVAAGVLGPFGELGRIAATTGIGIVKHIRQAKVAAGRRKFAESITGGVPYIPGEEKERILGKEIMGKAAGGAFTGMPGMAQPSMTTGGTVPYTGVGMPTAEGVEPAKIEKSKAAMIGMSGASLLAFFNKDAYNAKYTKELIQTLHNIEKKAGLGGGGQGGIIDNVKNAMGLLAKAIPVVGGVAGVAMGAWDAFKAQKVAKEEGWFGEKGKPLSFGHKVAAGVGGFFGGTGKGVGEKGATVGDVAKQAAWGVAKGAGIGAAVGSIIPGVGTAIGAAVGAAIGGITHAIGGKRIAKAAEAVWKISPMGMGVEAAKKLWNMFQKKPEEERKADLEKKKVDAAVDISKSEKKIEEKKVDAAIDIKKEEVKSKGITRKYEPSMAATVGESVIVDSGKDVNVEAVAKRQRAAMDTVRREKIEKIEPVKSEVVSPSMEAALGKIDETMRETGKIIKNVDDGKKTATMKKSSARDEVYNLGDPATDFLNTGYLGVAI